MQWSDWSSDVCSSDLVTVQPDRDLQQCAELHLPVTGSDGGRSFV
jgi:hypothetical protein